MIGAEFETPAEVNRLADFITGRITQATSRILYIGFLFKHPKMWNALVKKVTEGLDVEVFAPPVTSYSQDVVADAYGIYNGAGSLASKRSNLKFHICPLWWQKNKTLSFGRSLIDIEYTLHAKLLVIDDITYFPTSNFEGRKHYDICVYSDDKELSQESYAFSNDLSQHSALQTSYRSAEDMIADATRITVFSQVPEQKQHPFKKMLVVAPFYKYEPENFVRLKIAKLLDESKEFIDVMFQHFMPDVSKWSEPMSPSIMRTLTDRHKEGVDVRLLTATGVSDRAAIKAENAEILRSLKNEDRIQRGTSVHAKLICSDRGFYAGSMNINPTSLFQGYFKKPTEVWIDPGLHLLLKEPLPEKYVKKLYGVIWETTGFKSGVETVLVQEWNDENVNLRDKFRTFFNRCWSELGRRGGNKEKGKAEEQGQHSLSNFAR